MDGSNLTREQLEKSIDDEVYEHVGKIICDEQDGGWHRKIFHQQLRIQANGEPSLG